MTLILYSNCKDAKIMVIDRQEGFGTSNTQENKKYYLGTNNDLVIAFSASAAEQIDLLYTRISLKEPLDINNITTVLYEIVKEGPELHVDPMGEKGCMVTKTNSTIKYYELTLFRNTIAVIPSSISYRSIGDNNAISAANLLLVKSNIVQDDWQEAVQKLIGIMKNIAITNSSVNQIDRFGYDAFVFKNDYTLLHSHYTDSTKPEIELFFKKHDPPVIDLMFRRID